VGLHVALTMLTPSVLPILSMGARILRWETWMFCEYEGVTVQKGLFCSVSIPGHGGGGGVGGPNGDGGAGATLAAPGTDSGATFAIPSNSSSTLCGVRAALPRTRNPSTNWVSTSFGREAISQNALLLPSGWGWVGGSVSQDRKIFR